MRRISSAEVTADFGFYLTDRTVIVASATLIDSTVFVISPTIVKEENTLEGVGYRVPLSSGLFIKARPSPLMLC